MEKELINEDVLKEINNIIADCFENGVVGNDTSSEINNKAFRISKALGILVLKTKPVTYELTEKGIIVIQDGGIEEYLKNIRTEKFLDNQIKRLTKRKLDNEIRNNFLFALFGSLLTFFVTKFSESNTQKETLLQQNKLKFEILDSISKNRKHLHEQNKVILSLEKRIDSLTK